jgi:tetratricopeptide (TPR) repeat protein
MSYSHLGKFEDAIADMTTAAKIGTANRDVEAQLYCDRADAELSSKHFSSAADDYTRYMTLISSPDWARYTHRARAYAGCGKVHQAIQDMTTFVQAQRIRPKQRLGGYQYRASLYTSLKEYGKAISDLSSAIAIDPDKSLLYRERAKVYDLAGKKDLADKDSVKSKQIDAKLYGD